MTKRSFSTDFKREAASLVLDQNYSVSEACTTMGVGRTAIRRWLDQLCHERAGNTPKSKSMTPEQQRIQELEAHIRELKSKYDTLIKALVIMITDLQGRQVWLPD